MDIDANFTSFGSVETPMDVSSLIQNWHSETLSSYSSTDLDLFFHCWRRQSCDSCLSTKHACAWCATSQTCVPNERFKFPFGIIAPIKDENICPLAWKERWEMRARPFSCRCSTMTLMSVVIAVLSTLFGVLLLWILMRIARWGYGRWRKKQPGWWRVKKPNWNRTFWRNAPLEESDQADGTTDEEQRPLLG